MALKREGRIAAQAGDGRSAAGVGHPVTGPDKDRAGTGQGASAPVTRFAPVAAAADPVDGGASRHAVELESLGGAVGKRLHGGAGGQAGGLGGQVPRREVATEAAVGQGVEDAADGGREAVDEPNGQRAGQGGRTAHREHVVLAGGGAADVQAQNPHAVLGIVAGDGEGPGRAAAARETVPLLVTLPSTAALDPV